jgi:hypothetical protein
MALDGYAVLALRGPALTDNAKTSDTKAMKTLITTLGAMALATTLSIAQDKPPVPPPGAPGGAPGGEGGRRTPEEAFKRLDTNNDGSISLEEFKTGPRAQQNPERVEANFKRMDKDSNGKVTLEEFKAGRPQRPGGPGGEGGRPGAPGGGDGGKKPGGEKPPQ